MVRRRTPFLRPTMSQVLTFLIVCVAVLLIVNLGQKWLVWRGVLEEQRAISEVVREEEARRDALEQELAEAQSDAYAEKVVREDFGWVRDEEESVVLKYDGEAPAVATAGEAPAAEADGPPYWLEWLKLFLIP